MKWAFNDLKANKGIWAGVFLVLMVTQTVLCAMSVSMGIDDYYLGFSGETGEAARHLGSGLGLLYGTAVILGCLVIMLTLQAWRHIATGAVPDHGAGTGADGGILPCGAGPGSGPRPAHPPVPLRRPAIASGAGVHLA